MRREEKRRKEEEEEEQQEEEEEGEEEDLAVSLSLILLVSCLFKLLLFNQISSSQDQLRFLFPFPSPFFFLFSSLLFSGPSLFLILIHSIQDIPFEMKFFDSLFSTYSQIHQDPMQPFLRNLIYQLGKPPILPPSSTIVFPLKNAPAREQR